MESRRADIEGICDAGAFGSAGKGGTLWASHDIINHTEKPEPCNNEGFEIISSLRHSGAAAGNRIGRHGKEIGASRVDYNIVSNLSTTEHHHSARRSAKTAAEEGVPSTRV